MKKINPINIIDGDARTATANTRKKAKRILFGVQKRPARGSSNWKSMR